MTSPSHSQPHQEDDFQTQSPNSISTQHQETPDPQQQECPPTQILETPDPQFPQQSDLNQQDGSQILDHEDQEDPDHSEQSAISLSPPSNVSLQPIRDLHVTISDPTPPSLTSPTNRSRRLNKRKKGGGSFKKQQAIVKRLQTLTENLKPISFIPSKTLDFSKHEKLLKRLGLWDFVHVEFDRVIRVDLIAQLVATYDSKLRCSYVNGFRIMVSRADLARAIKLPVKKEKGTVLDGVDLDSEALSEESISFIEDLVSNWVLLHEDTWMMPSEVLNWTRVIKEGNPEKVDWASLFWFMVEKELTQGEQLGDCYYASHLQNIIKLQRKGMLREEPKVELEVEVEVEVKEEDDGDVNMGGSIESQGQDNAALEEPNIELTLGQDIMEKEEVKDDEMMDVEECKEEEDRRWLFDGKNSMGEHYLQRCGIEESMGFDSNEEKRQEDEEGEEEEEEEREEEEAEPGFNITQNDDTIERDGLTGDLLQGMETTQIPFGLQGQLPDQSSLDPLASRFETHTISGGPSFFGNIGKREIGHEHDISHHSLNGSNKRLRTDGSWDHKSSDFGTCMEHVQQWMDKARMIYEAKEQAYQESNLNQQLLMGELQRRGSVLEHMHATKGEELLKKDGEILRLERELYVMGNLLEGYRKALKETRRAFAEYRQSCQIPEEPVYKDAGPGGLVLSTTEIEKKRQKQEEEEMSNRLMIKQKFKDAEEEFIGKFEVHLNKVSMLDDKLMDFENEVKLLKELSAKRKVSEIQDGLQANDTPLAKSSF